MPKVNYIRSLIDSLSVKQLKELTEDYAKKDKAFEAFVVEKSGKAVDTGKTYDDYQAELEKLLKKCKSRRYGFYKVTRFMIGFLRESVGVLYFGALEELHQH